MTSMLEPTNCAYYLRIAHLVHSSAVGAKHVTQSGWRIAGMNKTDFCTDIILIQAVRLSDSQVSYDNDDG